MWFSTSVSSRTMDYTIGQGAVTEPFKWNSSISNCANFEVLVYEEDAAGAWNIHTGVLTIAVDPSATLEPGQFVYIMTINTSDPTLDPGTSATGLVKNYCVSIASPNHATANGATNPMGLSLQITFKNTCRDVTI